MAGALGSGFAELGILFVSRCRLNAAAHLKGSNATPDMRREIDCDMLEEREPPADKKLRDVKISPKPWVGY